MQYTQTYEYVHIYVCIYLCDMFDAYKYTHTYKSICMHMCAWCTLKNEKESGPKIPRTDSQVIRF